MLHCNITKTIIIIKAARNNCRFLIIKTNNIALETKLVLHRMTILMVLIQQLLMLLIMFSNSLLVWVQVRANNYNHS